MLWVSKTVKMLLQRKSLAIVSLSGEKYLIFMLLKVHKWTDFHLPKIINFFKTSFTATKELHQPRLVWPTRYVVSYRIQLLVAPVPVR